MSNPLYAAGITVVVSPHAEVFVEMRDAPGAVIAVAGMEVGAAVDFSEQLTDACFRALRDRPAETPAGAIH